MSRRIWRCSSCRKSRAVRISFLRGRIEQHRRGLLHGGATRGRHRAAGRDLLWRTDHRRRSQEALEDASGNAGLRFGWIPDIERRVACELAQGHIVARAKGAAEFGARALGNRSILARADSPSAVRVINQIIKNRDFWMPFAPSVLAERAAHYYEKPKPVESPYMMFAFRTRPERRAALAGAQHPYDFTTRPQEVSSGAQSRVSPAARRI